MNIQNYLYIVIYHIYTFINHAGVENKVCLVQVVCSTRHIWTYMVCRHIWTTRYTALYHIWTSMFINNTWEKNKICSRTQDIWRYIKKDRKRSLLWFISCSAVYCFLYTILMKNFFSNQKQNFINTTKCIQNSKPVLTY